MSGLLFSCSYARLCSYVRKYMRWCVLAHNMRSAYNVGALFRTADGAGAEKVFLTGYSPTPALSGALYVAPAQRMIAKTALGAEKMMLWEHTQSLSSVMARLRREGWAIVALEQHPRSIAYDTYKYPDKTAILVGNEPRGIDARTLAKCDAIVEIPMYGSKNSLNAVVALGIAGYTVIGKGK